MKASFFEFNVATSGLFLAKNALNVAGHNIANAKTEGFSRQVALVKTSQPLTFYDGKGMVGTGAEVYGIGQIRSAFLDQKYWHEKSVLGEYTVKKQQLTLTESVFNELSETSITSVTNDFFKSIQDLSTTTNDLTYRSNILKVAETFATHINSTYKTLEKQQQDLNEEVRATVSTMNAIGSQIRNLNEQITKFEMDGSNANDLRDQRATLVDQLSSYANVTVKEIELPTGDPNTPDRRFNVQINGTDFVNHFTVNSLDVEQRKVPINPDDEYGMYDVVWSNTGQKFDVYHPSLQGELKGLIDLRDGNNKEFMSGAAEVSKNASGKYEIKVTDPSKMDLLSNGKVSVYDPKTKREYEFTYDKLTKDESVTPPTYTFELTDMEDKDFAFVSNIDNMTARSGEATSYKGIPYYMSRLNDFVRTFAKAINEGLDHEGKPINGVTPYKDGYDINGENHGYLMFTYEDDNGYEETQNVTDYTKFTAKNFQVSSFLQKNPKFVAASDSATGGESNNNIMLNFSKIKNNPSLFREGKIGDYAIAVSSEIAIDLKQADSFESNYSDVVAGVQNQRLSVMGVDQDEETMNIIKFNQLFQASAKLINIIDGIYDTLINKLGA